MGKSFVDALAGSRREGEAVPDLGWCSTHRGEPALRLSHQEMTLLSSPFQNALVGRFPFRRPPMEVIRGFFVSLGLRGDCEVGLLDLNHVLIRPSLEEDFTSLFVRRSWFVKGAQMLISKWTLDFKANQDSQFAPVWVSLPFLPLPLFNALYIAKLAGLLGRCLKIDSATLSLRRPSVARVLVEMNVSKVPPRRVWIGEEQEGFWQEVVYESWPKFCGFCQRFGHEDGECFRKHPELKLDKREGRDVGKIVEIYRPKGSIEVKGPGDDSLLRAGSQQRPGGSEQTGRGSEGVDVENVNPEVSPGLGPEEAGKEVEREVCAVAVETGLEAPGYSSRVADSSRLEGDAGIGVEENAGLSIVSARVADSPGSPDKANVEEAFGGTRGESGKRAVGEQAFINSFGILQSLSDMEVQDFERFPSSSAGGARVVGQRHRRQLSDGDVPGETVPLEQLREFQDLLQHRLPIAPTGCEGRRSGMEQVNIQQQSLEGRLRGVRQKGGRQAKALLKQVPSQSQTHYSLRSNVKSN